MTTGALAPSYVQHGDPDYDVIHLITSLTMCSWKPIVENIEARFDAYLEQENRVNRRSIVDNRVHACLYFIQPTGHAYVQYVYNT